MDPKILLHPLFSELFFRQP